MKHQHDIEESIIQDHWFEKIAGSVPSFTGFDDHTGLEGSIVSSFDSVCQTIHPSTAQRIRAAAKNNTKTEFIIYLSFLGILLYKYYNINKLLITSPGIQQDMLPGENRNNLLFYQLEVTADTLLKNHLQRSRDAVKESFNYAAYDYENLILSLKSNNIDFQHLYRFGFYHQAVHTISNEFARVNMQFILEDKNNGPPGLRIKFNRSRFEKGFIRRLASHYTNLLHSFPENLDSQVRSMEILSPAEKKQILENFNDTHAGFPSDQTLVDLFAQQVHRFPGNTALLDEDRQLTYKELAGKSNQLAYYLSSKYHIKPGDLVGLLMERSQAMMIGILGILKSGAAYVPLDPDYPQHRLTAILKDASIKSVVTDNNQFIVSLRSSQYCWIRLKEGSVEADIHGAAREKEIPVEINAPSPGDPAYIIYTSGSTGSPKGVIVEHRNVVRLLFNDKFQFSFNPQDTWTLFHSVCFDFSVWEIFGALLYGGKLVMVTLSIARTPLAFLNLLEREQVTVLNQVPTMFNHLAREILESKKTRQLNLRYIIFGGEALAPALLKSWQEKYPGIKLVNMYGITETTVHVTYKEIGKKEIESGISNIGKPIPTLSCYLVDENLVPVPIEVPGEIAVGGEGVSRGYLNQPELTSEKFIQQVTGAGNRCKFINQKLLRGVQGAPRRGDPIRDGFVAKDVFDNAACTCNLHLSPLAEKSPPGRRRQRIYRSGDLGKWLENGDIQYLGRIDQQVKIRGFRIECGEIENRLLEIEPLKDVKVVAREDKEKNKYLAAYLLADETINTNQCREYLEKHVPGYMVPGYFIQLEKFPLTPSGKLDKKALPDPMGPDMGKVTWEYEAPANETEAVLALIWQEVLNLERVGVYENFFTLGGNSIKGIQVVNKIQEWLEEIIHVTIIFEAPTIRELAAKLQTYKYTSTGSTVDEAKINRMRQFIPSISPIPGEELSTLKNPPAIFILSPPRSGTTLLRVILAGHPRLFAPPELELLSFNRLQQRKASLSGRFSYFTEGVIRAIMEIKGCAARDALSIMEEFEKKNLTVQQFYRVLQEWLANRKLVDKTPFYSLDIDILERAELYFASPLYIHLIRNPYAVIHSFKEAKLDQILRFSHDFPVLELAELVWTICNQNIVEFLKGIPVERKLAVKFEDLVREPDRIVRETCEFLGIDYREEMIRVYENTANKMTNGIHAESKMLGDIKFFTHSSINTRTIDKWKEEYKTEFLGKQTVRLAKSFGYREEQPGGEDSRLKPILAAEKKEYYPLSSAQQGLYIMQQMDINNAALNIQQAFPLQGNINFTQLELIFKKLVARHESLRTSIAQVEDKSVQVVHDHVDFEVRCYDLIDRKEITPGSIIRNFRMPFDLSAAPLLRVGLIKMAEAQNLLITDMHHIISDGASVRTLKQDFIRLFQGEPLTPLRIQYRDFCYWQYHQLTSGKLKKQEEFWLNQFPDKPPVLNLSTDFPRPAIQSFEGNRIRFHLEKQLTTNLKALEKETGTTLFMVLLALYSILLSKLCRQKDIIIGSPIVGRGHPDLENIIGMLTETIVIRTYPEDNKPFVQFLSEVKTTTLGAYENQQYPFGKLLKQVDYQEDPSRHPLFDAILQLTNFESPSENPIIKEELKTLEVPDDNQGTSPAGAKADLDLIAVEHTNGISLLLDYCTKLFERETAAAFAVFFKEIAAAVGKNKKIKLKDIKISHDLDKANSGVYDDDESQFEF